MNRSISRSMKNQTNWILFAGLSLLAVACGKKDEAAPNVGNTGGGSTSCQAGYTWNGSGCVPISNQCQSGYVWNGSSCIPQNGNFGGGTYGNGYPAPGGNVLARCVGEFRGELLTSNGVQVCRIGQQAVAINYSENTTVYNQPQSCPAYFIWNGTTCVSQYNYYPNPSLPPQYGGGYNGGSYYNNPTPGYKLNRSSTSMAYWPRALGDFTLIQPGDQIVSSGYGQWGTRYQCDTSIDGYRDGQIQFNLGAPMGWSMAVWGTGEFATLQGTSRAAPYRVQTTGYVGFGFNAATDTGYRGVICGSISTQILRCFDNNGYHLSCQ